LTINALALAKDLPNPSAPKGRKKSPKRLVFENIVCRLVQGQFQRPPPDGWATLQYRRCPGPKPAREHAKPLDSKVW